MLLKTSNQVFTVFQTLRSYQKINVYLAKDATANANHYLINEICCPQIIRSNIEELLTLRQEQNSPGFVDIFTQDSKLYLVFKYAKPSLIMDYLHKNKLSFTERVKLLENYLFNLSAWTSSPLAISRSLTDLDNINLYSEADIFFNFSLKPDHFQEPKDRSTLFNNIATLIRVLFAKELNSKKGRQLHLIIEKCEKSIYKTVPQIAKEVQGVDISSSGEKFKQYLQGKRSLLKQAKDYALIALIAVMVVIVYTRFISPSAIKPSQPVQPVTQVGEVLILQETPSEQEPADSKDVNPPAIIRVDL